MDPILYWNDVALEAERLTHTTGAAEEIEVQGPAASSRALAITHLAMHDAYFGIKGGYEPYLGPGLHRPPVTADVNAAVAAAAHTTLSQLFPKQRAVFDARDAALGLSASKATDNGYAFGRLVGQQLLALRANDPSVGAGNYFINPMPPHHRPDPQNPGQGVYAPYYGARSKPFACTARHHTGAPPLPGDAEYERALRQVRSKGIRQDLIGTLPADLLPSRTAEETAIGLFWAYDGAPQEGTPTRFYNQIVRRIAMDRNNDVAKNARLFALVNAALADAGIFAWADKYSYDLWRPVVGIREAALVSKAADAVDAFLGSNGQVDWLPMGAPNTNNVGKNDRTPPFPSYPSGHATFGGAVFQTVRHFYGQALAGPDTLTQGMEFVSQELDGVSVDSTGTVRPRVVRHFPGGLWQMMAENGLSRVYLGVHWFFDAFALDEAGQPDLTKNIGGVPLGIAVANDIAAHGLKASAAAGLP
ncbi:MAG: phosphatase PAP2 family protein [Jatrophihabitantaceae bacterium]